MTIIVISDIGSLSLLIDSKCCQTGLLPVRLRQMSTKSDVKMSIDPMAIQPWTLLKFPRLSIVRDNKSFKIRSSETLDRTKSNIRYRNGQSKPT